MDHVRSLVALTHDRKAPDYIQFVKYLEVYTQLRYKLEQLKQYRTNSYEPTDSLLTTAHLTFEEILARNEEIPTDSDEYERNEEWLNRVELQKEAEIEVVRIDLLRSVESIVNSAYIQRYKYSPAYLDMLRQQLIKNHFP